MSATKKIFFPSTDGDVAPFVSNADKGLTTGGLGLKYGISAADMAQSASFKVNVPLKINASEISAAASQADTTVKDKIIHDAQIFYNAMGHAMQKHAAYDPADLDTLGFFKSTTPPDPLTALPVVSRITVLSDQVIIDWVRGPWSGVMIRASYDGITWEKLDKDNRSPYEDTRKNKVANVPETRYYKLRYLDNDTEIGLEVIVKAVAEIY